MIRRVHCSLFFLFALIGIPVLRAGEIKKETKQIILGLADNWDSSNVTLTHFERGPLGQWKSYGSWSGRLGRNGLAWGIGLHDIPAGATLKREGDGRTPAGIFDISQGAFGYAPSIRKLASLPYQQITNHCLWFEDTSSPYYNSFQLIDHEPRTSEEKKAQMRQDDYAHALKLFIAHNAPPRAKPGYGSAIFFHIWREDGTKSTAGCTTMSEHNLQEMIAHIDPAKNPRYVILPKSEYEKVKDYWKLP